MKRKMVFIGMGYACGLFFASFFNFLISLIIALSFVITAFFCLKLSKVKQLALFSASFFIAIGAFNLYTHFVYNKIIAYDGKTIDFSGKIVSVRTYQGDRALYIAKGKTADGKKMKLCFYTEDYGGEWGDKISVTGDAKITENTYTFAEADYYRSEGVYLKLENAQVNGIFKQSSPIKLLLRWRDNVMNRFRSVLPNDEGDALCAMLFGEKTGLDSKAKTLMYRCGIGHVMSTSGLHLVICASAVLWVLQIFTKNRRIQAIVIIFVSALFVICAGMSVAVIRAFVMLLLLYSARFFFREADSLNSLSIALLVLLIPSPYAAVGSSLLLSAVGTFGIGVAAPYLSSVVSIKRFKPIFTMLCVSLCVFPVSMMFFDEVSLISPIMNLLLIPICTLALVLEFIAALLPFSATGLINIAGALCRIVLYVCEKVGRLSFAFIPSGSKFLLYFAFLGSAVIFLVWMASRKPQIIIQITALLVCTFFLLSSYISYSRRDLISVAWFGYDKGYAAVISKGNTAIIIDTGAANNADESVSKYLSRRGITSIPIIIINEKAASRVPAYIDELELFSLGKIYISSDYASLPAEVLSEGSSVVFCGYQISFDDSLEIHGSENSFLSASDRFVDISGRDIFLTSDTFEITFR